MFWHPSHYQISEPEEIDGQGASRPRDLLKWVVRLRFERNDESNVGTGFFLNVPASEWYVILTAAHNLIDEKGKKSKNLLVETWERTYAAQDIDRIEICPQYLESLDKDITEGHNANVDYGAILILKASGPNAGFGFALEISQRNLFDTTLKLIGYKPQDENPSHETQQPTKNLEPDARSGPCLADKDGYLTYKMATTPGLSGSPIYIPFKGYDTVVAIHNNGETSDKKEATGARLSCEALEQIFDWVKLYSRRRALRAERNLTAEAHGSKDKDPLYLHFVPQAVLEPERMGEPENAWACIHRTKDGMSTYLDVLPGYSSPSTINNEMLWAFCLHHAGRVKRYWVLWNVVKKEVTLTDTLQEHCFVRLVTKKPESSIPKVFWIVLTDPVTSDGQPYSLCQLSMDASAIEAVDIAMCQKVWPNLVFTTHMVGKDKSKKFEVFLLE
ncbi:hypothetical protein ARSEF1564_000395 [Beauveria bassiana]